MGGLIPWNLAELAEAVPIALYRSRLYRCFSVLLFVLDLCLLWITNSLFQITRGFAFL